MLPVVPSAAPIRVASRNASRIPPAITAARSATSRRTASGIPVVTDRNVGARPIGSTTMKRVTAAEMRYSSGMAPPERFGFVSDGVALRPSRPPNGFAWRLVQATDVFNLNLHREGPRRVAFAVRTRYLKKRQRLKDSPAVP